MYKQVELISFEETCHQMAWIPKEFAVVGKYLSIHDQLYKVVEVYKYSIKDPIYPEHLIREHRKNTGDSRPKGV